MASYVQISTATSTQEAARAIADALVERRLAACVQVLGPIRSTYRWRGAVERADEWLCLIKSERALYPDIESMIRNLHSYETPEITVTEIIDGYDGYLDWIRDSIDADR
jgi:periplasmic divalent cation tolerance protein